MVRKTIESEWCDGKREDELAIRLASDPRANLLHCNPKSTPRARSVSPARHRYQLWHDRLDKLWQ